MKSYQYWNFDISENILYSYFATIMFRPSWFGDIKQLHEPWNYGARDARAFYVFRSF